KVEEGQKHQPDVRCQTWAVELFRVFALGNQSHFSLNILRPRKPRACVASRPTRSDTGPAIRITSNRPASSSKPSAADIVNHAVTREVISHFVLSLAPSGRVDAQAGLCPGRAARIQSGLPNGPIACRLLRLRSD